MATVRDFLERLRPSGTPGAASLSGVPADRVGERIAELEPVFARLEDVQVQATAIRQAAAQQALRRQAAAAEQAQAIVAAARRSAEAERRDTAARARSRADEETQARLAAAARDATSLAQRAQTREPELVARVVELARDEVAELVAESR